MTVIAVNVPVPIVSVVFPLSPEELAVIVTVPLFLACAIPDARIAAIFGFDDFQDTPVRFVAVLPSLNVPVAVNFSCVPVLTRGLTGVTAIETRCALDTVSPVDPVIEPNDALIVVLPVATLEARPWAVMVAAAGAEEVHTTVVVMS